MQEKVMLSQKINYAKKSDAYEGVKPNTLFLHDEVGHWENPKMKFNFWLPKLKYNMKGSLLVLIGISGSGKSTYAHNLWLENPDKYVIVNRDKVRELLFGYTEASVEEYYRKEKIGGFEKQVTRYCDTLIHDGLNHGKTVIIDSTNLTLKYINSYRYWNVPTEFKSFDISLEDAIARDLKRVRQVGEKVITKQYARYLSLRNMALKQGVFADFTPVTIEMNRDNKKCIIFDIDGTVAHMNRGEGGRSPYDWHRVNEDVIDYETSYIVRLLEMANGSSFYHTNEDEVDVIICTGRDGAALEETIKWLNRYQLKYDKIYIREKGDMRADWIVKEEMWREIAQDYNIMGMFDDRLQVVRRARALGLKVFNVEYHNF